MKKLGIAALVAASLVGASAQSASASEPIGGPCATQRDLFDKYNIQIDMYAPAVSWAYTQVCNVTG